MNRLLGKTFSMKKKSISLKLSSAAVVIGALRGKLRRHKIGDRFTFPENRVGQFVQIVALGDFMCEMSTSFLE